MPEATRSFWMIVTSADNYARTKALGYRQQGMKTRHRRKAERMAPGDGLCWYVTGHQTFAGTATITSPFFESTDPIWVSDGAPDVYPWRVRLKKERVLAPERGVTAESLVPKLRFVRKWPKKSWRLAFQGNVHELSAEDFALIARAVASA
ncbi:MAG TPA: EVE domain-containing protein [Candidatus Limnocylindrales bacterium]|nr:EVE domain-containing protein [Candidatus Limnocylindrales bacterium]